MSLSTYGVNMNIVKKYYSLKSIKPISKVELSKRLGVDQSLIHKMINGMAIPEARKLDVYLIIYSSLPNNAQTYIIKDVDKMLKKSTDEAKALTVALNGWK